MQSVTWEESPQADGRKYITWRFVDDAGVHHMEVALMPGNYDPSVDAAAQGARWDAMLISAEIQQNLSEIADG
jgi:hypothetical protein